MKKPARQTVRTFSRKGGSTVEFAVVFPILFTLLCGSIEFARANQVVNAASFAAYQGCRQAIIPGGTATAANNAAQQVLTSTYIETSTITVSPSTVTDSTPTVTVSVTVNLANVGWITPLFTNGISVTRTCTLTREQTQ